MRLILLFAFTVICLDAVAACSGKGCLTNLESAVRTCSDIKDDSPWMDCIRKYPAHSNLRRRCLNVQGHPQLAICGDPNMSVPEVIKCFEGAAAAEPWEECVVKLYLESATTLTALEKAYVKCTPMKKNIGFALCVTAHPANSGMRHNCLNKNGTPQLDICAKPMQKHHVVSCFRGAAAPEVWEDCVVSEYLGVYSKSVITCLPEVDAKYKEEFKKRDISPQGYVSLIGWMKQGRPDAERRGLEYFATYIEKCFYPGDKTKFSGTLPTVSRLVSTRTCKIGVTAYCGFIGTMCWEIGAKIPGWPGILLKGACAIAGAGCVDIRTAECEKAADEDKEDKCNRICWEVKNGCWNNIYCNGYQYGGTPITTGSCCKTPQPAPGACRQWDSCHKARNRCRLNALKKCQIPTLSGCSNLEYHKCRDKGCCIGRAKHGPLWGGCYFC